MRTVLNKWTIIPRCAQQSTVVPSWTIAREDDGLRPMSSSTAARDTSRALPSWDAPRRASDTTVVSLDYFIFAIAASAARRPDIIAPSNVAGARWSPHTYSPSPRSTVRAKSVGAI